MQTTHHPSESSFPSLPALLGISISLFLCLPISFCLSSCSLPLPCCFSPPISSLTPVPPPLCNRSPSCCSFCPTRLPSMSIISASFFPHPSSLSALSVTPFLRQDGRGWGATFRRMTQQLRIRQKLVITDQARLPVDSEPRYTLIVIH